MYPAGGIGVGCSLRFVFAGLTTIFLYGDVATVPVPLQSGHINFLPFLVNELSKRGYNNGEFCVVWIGLPIYLEFELFIIDELKKLQLENSYRLLPASEKFPSIINASNLILSLSREDSNPQVLTYAEHLAKPILKLNDLYSQNNLSWQDNLILLIDKIESNTWAKIELSHANKRNIRNWSEVTNEIIKKIDSFYE